MKGLQRVDGWGKGRAEQTDRNEVLKEQVEHALVKDADCDRSRRAPMQSALLRV